MVFEIKSVENSKLRDVYNNCMDELNDFFEITWIQNKPKLFILPDRKIINDFYGIETKDYVVGFSKNRDVYLLSKENYETESNHTYSDDEYFKLLKHELTHCFTDFISKQNNRPIWLIEGIAIYLSKQTEIKYRPTQLNGFLEFDETYGTAVYSESGFAVEYLVETYGKEKILSLFKRLKEVSSRDKFKVLFKEIYGFELKYENFKVL